jgi:O-antigen/teichoic acid export membrane protein
VFGIGGALRQALAFLLLPLYTKYLTPDAFGTLALFLIITNLVSILPQSIAPALFRSYYDFESHHERSIAISSALFLTILLTGTLIFIGVLLSSRLSTLIFHKSGYEYLWTFVLCTGFFNGISLLGLAILRARKASWQFAIVSVSSFFAQLVATIYFVAIKKQGVDGVLTGGLIGALINTSLLFPFMKKEIVLKISRVELKKLWTYGWPFIPTQAMGFVMQSADRVILERTISLAAVGIYTLGQRLSSIVSLLFIEPFSLIVIPIAFSAEKDKDAKLFYVRLFTYYTLIACGTSLMVSTISKDLLKLIAGPEYWPAQDVVPLISLSLIVYGARSLVGISLALNRRTYYFPLAVGAGMIVNLLALTILVPAFASIGAAWASLIGSLVVCVIHYLANRYHYPLPFEWLRIAKILGVAIVIYGLESIIEIANPIPGILFHVFFLLAYPIILYAIGFFEKQELIYTRQSMNKLLSWIPNSRKRSRR